jgi:hypothetical protein
MYSKNNSTTSVYLNQLFVWFGLVILSGLSVVLAGLDLGKALPFIVLVIAAVQVYVIARAFMNIRPSDKIAKVFIGISGLILAVSLLLVVA